MARTYSVFMDNVGSCSDRYCSAYGRPFTPKELLERAASIDLITGIDFVATPSVFDQLDEIKRTIADTGLHVVSVVADVFTEAKWRQGSYSSRDEKVRREAIDHSKRVMDLNAELGSSLLTLWPGQDGYDYVFQADYVRERELFMEAVRELCEHNRDMTVGLEYKAKEPRTHSYVNTVGTTILMAQAIGENCGVILDFGHALLGYENPAESVAVLHQFGDRMCHVHINDNWRYWDDDMIVGTVRVAEFLEFFYWLRKTGYDGWITIDQFPYREDGKDAVEESTLWLDRLQLLIDRVDDEKIESVLAQKDGVAASRLIRELVWP